MNKIVLPVVITQAQLKMREDKELLTYFYSQLKKLSTMTERKEILKYVHAEIDKNLSEEVKEATCRKGCHFCCYHPISIAIPEEENILQFKKYLNESSLACKFLRDGECSIYENRPLICRLTHVKTPAENCQKDNQKIPIEHLPVYKAALVAAAFYNAFPETKLLNDAMSV
jgi:Fe-S-cluster containining protein